MSIATQLRGAREEWRTNTRLKWGVALVALIAFAYACLVLGDWRRDLHDEYQDRTIQLYKMTALADQDYWLARAQSAQAIEKALQAEVPSASTIGLAQAEVQTLVRQLMNAYGRGLSSDASPPSMVSGQPGLWRVPVTLRGVVSQGQLLEILRRLENSDRLIVVEEFTFTFGRGVPNFSLTMVGYYRIAAAGAPEAADAVG